MPEEETLIIPAFFCALLSLIAGFLAAKRKGRSASLWGIACAIFAPLLIVVELIPSARPYNDPQRRTWPGMWEWLALLGVWLIPIVTMVPASDGGVLDKLADGGAPSSATLPDHAPASHLAQPKAIYTRYIPVGTGINRVEIIDRDGLISRGCHQPIIQAYGGLAIMSQYPKQFQTFGKCFLVDIPIDWDFRRISRIGYFYSPSSYSGTVADAEFIIESPNYPMKFDAYAVVTGADSASGIPTYSVISFTEIIDPNEAHPEKKYPTMMRANPPASAPQGNYSPQP